jgi:two-component system cell cycle response regulator DivK
MATKVLVVEDNDLNRKLFTDLLRLNGYDAVEANRGNDVLVLSRTERPDIILMDIQLPDISGVDLTRALKADPSLKDIPIIAVTAFAMGGDEERIRKAGCDGYIAKPVAVRDFLATLAKFRRSGAT